MRHVISAIVENKPGVLAHIAGLFAGRGFNIDSLAVGETEDAARSRMTVVVRGDDAVLEQVRKQLGKIIDVIKVTDYSDTNIVERDLMLAKVSARPEKRGEIFEIVGVFRGKVVDIGPKHLTLEVSGPEEKIDAFIDLLRPYGIKEVVRTGRIALARGG
jgi:acetolactate synthase-1/3 small subunit